MAYPSLESNLAQVRDRIATACVRSGRDPADVGIVAVTKNHPPEAIVAVRAAGLTEVGENRVQELEGKVSALGREFVGWHLIGHLQRNKARLALRLADLIHSVDSVALAGKLSELASESGVVAQVLVQVNAGEEATKGGLDPTVAMEEIGQICALPGLKVRGLMTMAPFTDDEILIRAAFARARMLRDEAARDVDGFEPRHLSMGMSNDYWIAVEEGSTLLRLGTVLLGERHG
jgi:pyridoxal phosphate enzyme (YggS family)